MQSWLKIVYKYGGRKRRIVRFRANSKTSQKYQQVSWNEPDIVCMFKPQNTETTHCTLIFTYVLFYD
jgi:hypothetical protein